MFTTAAPASAKSYSGFYIKISDARTALSEGKTKEALTLVKEMRTAFAAEENADSKAGREVQAILDSATEQGKVTESSLRSLSAKLLAFEKEQNPVDVKAEKANFKKKVYPALAKLEEVIKTGQIEAMKQEYLSYNAVWTRNESLVRSTSTAHYGTIETAMSLLRSSMEAEPPAQSTIESSLSDLRTALDNFTAGKKAEQHAEVTTLKEGIKLLEEAQSAFVRGSQSKGQKKMKTFISSWPVFEGEVSTRSSALYNKVESQTPIIMIKGSESRYQKELEELISQLRRIDKSGSYNFIDAMLILLREGVEALLIVLALVGTLKASRQKKGLKWVYAGAAVGVLASFLAAWLLQNLFPAVSSGTNREIIEGLVGILAVAMMLGVGIWLHSKSSAKAWQAYMDRQMAAAVSAGGFISMFVLSFLAVFREGAETILFYAGILPRISQQAFWLGVGLAVLALIVLAYLLVKFSDFIPVNKLFLVLTWLIYALAFKMLGTSIHHLQLTGILTNHVISGGPSFDILGLYPSWEVVSCQLIFVLLLAAFYLYQKRKEATD